MRFERRRYIVNGVEYARLEDVPAEFRALLAGGVPDAVKTLGGGDAIRVETSRTTTYTVNGVTYSSPDEMPPEARMLFERLMGGGGAPAGMLRSLGGAAPPDGGRESAGALPDRRAPLTVQVEGSVSGGFKVVAVVAAAAIVLVLAAMALRLLGYFQAAVP